MKRVIQGDDGKIYETEEEAIEADKWWKFRELLKDEGFYGSINTDGIMALVKEHLTFKK